jgi:hypothetical protein
MVKDHLVNGFLLIVEAADEIIGEPSELPERSLWSGQDAARLAEAARVLAEAEAAAKAKAEVIRLEAERPRTLEEVGIDAVEVPKDRPGDPAPWKGGTQLWPTEKGLVFGFRPLLALHLPTYSGDGLRVLAASEVVPPSCAAIPEATPSALAFARWMAARYSKDPLDLGPVGADRWTTEGLPRIRELAALFAPVFLNATLAHLWDHYCQVLVRALLGYPPQVERIIAFAMRGEEIRRNPPFKIPSRFAERERAIEGKYYAQPETATVEVARIDASAAVPVDPNIAAMCLSAAKGGSVSIGALLAPTFPTTPKPSIKKAGK